MQDDVNEKSEASGSSNTSLERQPGVSDSNTPPQDNSTVIPADTIPLQEAVSELPLAPLPKAGYNLAKFILWIITGYVFFITLFLSFKNLDASKDISKAISITTLPDSTFIHQKDIIRSLQDEQKSHRDFVIQMSQMILLNLLLPTLTAILGYMFGARESNRNSTSTNNSD